ncbi:MAG: hypothetical protein JXR25_10540 [Pontiellaceae bacterium]|nr:hypothetical protein [Pontiellaceae bacterium]MBN2785257.1 hypothetical protein [Pontiellaceae bacterium]
MAETTNEIDRNLADSIAMLEQILEVMPHDSDALKALYSAYRRVGQHQNAFGYLVRLTDVCIKGREPALAPYIEEEVRAFEALFPSDVAALRSRLQGLNDSATAPSAVTEPARSRRSSVKREADIGEELALAWRLYEENQLDQEEYSSVLHDLTEVSSKDLNVPVSVLHVLNDRGFTQMNRILNYLSSRSGAPGIRLSDFEISEDVASALPFNFAAHEGALPFAFMGNDLLVAVLNPFNHILVDRIESDSGRRCHTYLVEPEDYDQALGRVRALVGDANSQSQG